MELGGECEPRDVRMDAGRLGEAVELVRSRKAAAQLCVLRDGRVVVDQAFGCPPDALFWLFSASKPYVAIVIHQLVEAGRLHLDDAVAAYWHEFGENGKREITVRQMLQHRSGLTTVGSYVGDARAMADWDLSLRRIEQARPRWPIGTVAYSPLAFGFILGEVAHRCSGQPIEELVRRSVLEPLGVVDTYLGLPADQWDRHVPIRVSGAARSVHPVGGEPAQYAGGRRTGGRDLHHRTGPGRAVSGAAPRRIGRLRPQSIARGRARADQRGRGGPDGAGADPVGAGVPARRAAVPPGSDHPARVRRAVRGRSGTTAATAVSAGPTRTGGSPTPT